MYDFARGPLVWIAFIVFFGGSLYRIISTIQMAKKEKVVIPYMSFKYGMRSILHWLTPFGARNMRLRPVFTILTYLFHVCLIITPLFALGHTISWRESWGIGIISLPENLTNIMTIYVILCGLFLILRRIGDPTVRNVSDYKDFVLILMVLAPFAFGLLAYYRLFDYNTIIILHIWTGAIWLMAIPFTRISHMLFFPLTRAYMGSEFGLVRNSRDW